MRHGRVRKHDHELYWLILNDPMAKGGPKAGKAKGKAKQEAAQEEQLTGAEALRIKAQLEAGQQPPLGALLGLLNAAAPCAGLYSKDCKVREYVRLRSYCSGAPEQ